MTPTRILYCIESIDRGGTETQLVELINRLDRSRFEPHLCTLRPSGEYLREADCPVLELGVGRLVSPGGWRSVRRLGRYVEEHGIRIVQSFFQDPTLLAMPAARMGGAPVRLVSFRDMGFWRTPLQEFMMRRAYPLVTGFLANSEAVKFEACRRDRLDSSRVQVVYNGLDKEPYPFVEHLESEIAIGIVGNLNRDVKRTDLFLRAAARIADRHPDVRWHVVGDGNLRPGLEALAEELGIAERVEFAGRIADVPGYLRRLAVGVLCSDSEGLSNAMLEYMLSGCAVIATAVGGNLELVRDGQTGLLVPPGNETALAGAMSRLIEQKTTRLMLSLKARTMVEKNFSWETCVEAHQEFYRGQLLVCRGEETVTA